MWLLVISLMNCSSVFAKKRGCSVTFKNVLAVYAAEYKTSTLQLRILRTMRFKSSRQLTQIFSSTPLGEYFVATLTIMRFESSRMSKNERILYVVPFDFCDPTCRLRVKCLLQKHDPWAEKPIRMLQVNDLCLYPKWVWPWDLFNGSLLISKTKER